MKLIPDDALAQLFKNWSDAADGADEGEMRPVLKLFYPFGSATWLITSIDPEAPEMVFGLADLGLGSPELGYISIDELEQFQGRFGIGIERDLYFTPEKSLQQYADEAREAGRIVA